jgi:hypothetical protein
MLNTRPNIASSDDFYEALLAAHQDLSTEESHALDARLVLLLANHIGEMAVLADALRIARGERPAAAPVASATSQPAE